MKFLKPKDNYQTISELLFKIKKEYEEVFNLSKILTENDLYLNSDDKIDNDKNLNIILHEIIENKTYNILLEGSPKNQLEEHDKLKIAFWTEGDNFYVSQTKEKYNIEEFVPTLDKNGDPLIMLGKDFVKKYKYDNDAGLIASSFFVEVYELPEDFYKEEINKLKALDLMLDENKLELIITDLSEKISLLKRTEDNINYWINLRNEDKALEEIDNISKHMNEFAQDLPI